MPQVQGKRASDLEFNLAAALSKNKWSFEFQVGFFGGRSVAGGFVIDFAVDTAPLPTPVNVQGAYWHTNEQREQDKLVQSMFTSVLSSSYAQLLFAEERECDTFQNANAWVLKNFGRAA